MISFNIENVSLKLSKRLLLKSWIKSTIAEEKKQASDISFIFCSDEYLLGINREYLNHSYYTDVITFDYTDGLTVSGDIFISIDTVKANAEEFEQAFYTELYRVMVHGVLHLCGYKDATDSEKTVMRQKEDYYLTKLNIE